MKKSLIFLLALTASTALWAQDLQMEKDQAIKMITSFKDNQISLIKMVSTAVCVQKIQLEGINQLELCAQMYEQQIQSLPSSETIDALRETAILDIIKKGSTTIDAINAAINAYNTAKNNAISTLNEAAEGKSSSIQTIITNAIAIVNTASFVEDINAVKDLTFYAITSIEESKAEGITEGDAAGYARGKAEGIEEGDAAGYARGKAEGLEESDAAGYARAKAELPTDPEGTAGTAVTITKGSKSVTLINPDKVTYVKTE